MEPTLPLPEEMDLSTLTAGQVYQWVARIVGDNRYRFEVVRQPTRLNWAAEPIEDEMPDLDLGDDDA